MICALYHGQGEIPTSPPWPPGLNLEKYQTDLGSDSQFSCCMDLASESLICTTDISLDTFQGLGRNKCRQSAWYIIGANEMESIIIVDTLMIITSICQWLLFLDFPSLCSDHHPLPSLWGVSGHWSIPELLLLLAKGNQLLKRPSLLPICLTCGSHYFAERQLQLNESGRPMHNPTTTSPDQSENVETLATTRSEDY